MELGHDYFMRKALAEAQKAAEDDEVPIGAVVVLGNEIIGRGYNQTRRLNDNTAHAEILAITAASNYMGSGILEDCRIYVTIEPCAMCAGALKWARPSLVVVGAPEPKFGFSQYKPHILHPSTAYEVGVMQDECAAVMKEFFRKKRAEKEL